MKLYYQKNMLEWVIMKTSLNIIQEYQNIYKLIWSINL